jgi:hypothetical protein
VSEGRQDMRRTAKKTGLLITSAAAGLATLSQCSAGLLGDLFDKQCNKDRQEIEKRMPASDCSFGYFSTAWQPWGTCDQNSGAGCSSGTCRNSAPSIIPGFQPGYSSGPSSSDLQPYRETWQQPGTTDPLSQPGMIHSFPSSQDCSPSPILMTPIQPEPAADHSPLPPLNLPPPVISQPPVQNPFPRAIRTNPERPTLNANPYSNPGFSPVPNTPLPIAPQPQLSPGFSVPLDSPRPSAGLPAPGATPQSSLPQPFLPQPAPNYGSQGTGITLPPRRATSVTIDIPAGSAGTTLSLPDPARSGSTFGGDAGSPFPETGNPATTPNPAVAPLKPLTPEPSLRPQPPVPMPSAIPGPASTYRMPPQQFVPQQTVPQFPAVQHANTQPAVRQYPAVPPQQFQQRPRFQPATHWQAVPQRQPQQQTNWRVIPGAHLQQPDVQQLPQAQPQRRIATPSERVIYLPPPPRR